MKHIILSYLFSMTLASTAQFQNGGIIPGQGLLLSRVTNFSQMPTPTTDNVIVMNLGNAQNYRWDLATSTWINYDSINIVNMKNVNNGIAGLDGSGKISTSVLPATVVQTTDTSAMLSPYLRKANVRDSARAAFTSGSNVSIVNGVISVPSVFSHIYDKSGLISSNGKYFCDTFTISVSNPTISLASYLSTAGCSSFKLNSAVAFRSGATTSNSPNVTVTALSSNSVTLILNQTNTATVTILGINVLSGLPTILVPDPTNVKVVLSFIMY